LRNYLLVALDGKSTQQYNAARRICLLCRLIRNERKKKQQKISYSKGNQNHNLLLSWFDSLAVIASFMKMKVCGFNSLLDWKFFVVFLLHFTSFLSYYLIFLRYASTDTFTKGRNSLGHSFAASATSLLMIETRAYSDIIENDSSKCTSRG
jgi:hypothetical protein